MAAIKSLSDITDKWRGRADAAQADYAAGVERTKKDWAARTAAAAGNYATGVQEALAAGRFERGVAAAGHAKWKSATLTKGPARWAQGIRVSGDAYARGFSPYRDVIESLALPDRGPRGDARNYDRSRVVGEALHAKRIAG